MEKYRKLYYCFNKIRLKTSQSSVNNSSIYFHLTVVEKFELEHIENKHVTFSLWVLVLGINTFISTLSLKLDYPAGLCSMPCVLLPILFAIKKVTCEWKQNKIMDRGIEQLLLWRLSCALSCALCHQAISSQSVHLSFP